MKDNKSLELPKEIKLKTILKISKMERKADVLNNIISIAKRGKASRCLRFLAKNDFLPEEYEEAFVQKFKRRIEQTYKSTPFKKILIDRLKEDIENNDYNNNIPSSIKRWVVGIICAAKDPSSIYRFDGWKLYQYLEIETSTENWTSHQGAYMTDEKANVKFYFEGIEHEKDFDLGTTGYWN